MAINAGFMLITSHYADRDALSPRSSRLSPRHDDNSSVDLHSTSYSPVQPNDNITVLQDHIPVPEASDLHVGSTCSNWGIGANVDRYECIC